MPIPKYYVRPDGLHESIITVNGKRKAFRGKTDREVWNKIKAYRAEAEKPKTVPFSDVAHAWWNEIEPTLAPNSLRNYSPAYDRAVAQFGPEDVATITSKEVETYINQFAKTHAKKTVITQRQIIRQILNKAQREGYVSFNAAQAVLLPKNLPQKRRHAPPADQIQKIKDNLNDDFGLFAFLIYYTGCRRGEAEGLRYEDIDREKGRIYIRRSVYHTGPTPQIKEPKTAAGIRPVPLLPALAAALPQKKHGYIFSNDGGKSPLPGWFVTDQFDAYRKRTGITVSPHEIRHGYATALYEAGVTSNSLKNSSATRSSPPPWISTPTSSIPALIKSPPRWTRPFNCTFYCVGHCVHTRVFSCYDMLRLATLQFSQKVLFNHK